MKDAWGDQVDSIAIIGDKIRSINENLYKPMIQLWPYIGVNIMALFSHVFMRRVERR